MGARGADGDRRCMWQIEISAPTQLKGLPLISDGLISSYQASVFPQHVSQVSPTYMF